MHNEAKTRVEFRNKVEKLSLSLHLNFLEGTEDGEEKQISPSLKTCETREILLVATK